MRHTCGLISMSSGFADILAILNASPTLATPADIPGLELTPVLGCVCVVQSSVCDDPCPLGQAGEVYGPKG